MNVGSGAGGAAGREEIQKTFTLDAGATVEVREINGTVEINTADTDRAEVSIVRTATNEDDLESRHVFIEHEPSRLVIRGESDSKGFWRRLWGGGTVKQQVVLTLPRRVEIEARSVNGAVTISEVDGAVSIAGVNGRVEVAGARGHADVAGVNGGVKFSLAGLDSEGVDVKGVNGSVQILTQEVLNADISVKGLNGGFSLTAPNVTMQERKNRANIQARLGSGGTPINFSGVNGNVTLQSNPTAESTVAAQPISPLLPATQAPPAPPTSIR
jgi:DUF4097 and DUF4098 domain-containing protein YvlB